MTHVTTSSHPPSPMGPPRPLPTPPVTRSISRSAGSPSLVSSSSETMNEYPHDLRGTYSCEVIEPGTEGTEIIPMRKEINDQLHNDEEETGTIVTSPVVTPVELNKNLLNTLFKFNPLSKLKCFLVSKTGVEKTYYSLAEILTILKNIIKGEGMFDHTNPSVIICSPELERALNMKALHVTEIRNLVLSQITKVPDQSLRKTTNISRTKLNFKVKRESNQQTQQQHSSRITRTANISTAIFTDKNAKFTLKPKFLKVVRLVPCIDNTQTVFSYEEVTFLLSKYILARKKEIFDPRNIKLALVGNDPLGDAFGVKAFHRCQVNNLLRSQLIPVNSDYPPDVAIVIRTNRTNSGLSGYEVVSGEEEKRPLQEMEKEKESSIAEENDNDDNS